MIMSDVMYIGSHISICKTTRQTQTYCCSRKRDFKPHLQSVSRFSFGFEVKILNHKSSRIKSFELASVCEAQSVSVQKGTEGVCENYSQSTLPPWGDLSDQNSEYKNRLDFHSETSVNPVCTFEDEMYYLEERDEQILSNRILKLSRSNKIRSALTLYRSMVFSDLLPNSHACNSLLYCLLRNERLDDALNVFDFMKSRDIATGHTYSLILKAVARFRDSDAALRIFEEAEQNKKTKKCLDTVVYNTLISIFGKTDEWARAERIWRSLQENGPKGTAVTYRILICTFVRCGQNELALDAYREMIQNGLGPHEDAMQAIIGACTREGKWDLALNVFRNMMDSKLKPSLITCNALLNSLGKASRVKLAFEIYNLMKSLGYSPDAYTWHSLIGALNRANRYADALRLFESIRKEQKEVLNVHIYNACLMSCQRLGLWEKAVEIIWEMEVSGFLVSVVSYNLVIGACEVARKPKVALQVYEQMAMQKLSPDVFTRLSLVRSCAWGSLWDKVEEILKAEPNGSLYNAAIQGMCLKGRADLARKLYKKMHEMGLKPEGKTRALMLQNLKKG
ncbi:pentatricopeptide repeat (PPR) superfamily protein [Striga asiatica]|uniref:Pentatricopeptide repeat (PPR) superfamily protein n=1 Tax=Striga asiatica TaxID=4170 RepID=A0A5A7QY72_STRAF|nr:pentatricopeptide repeat (PPR) superfamily protein [Striga asiatica]